MSMIDFQNFRIEFSPETIAAIRQTLSQWEIALVEWLQSQRPMFAAMRRQIAEVRCDPRLAGLVRCYEDQGMSADAAALMTYTTLRSGEWYRDEKMAERRFTSAVRKLMRAPKNATTLVLSRRATAVRQAWDGGIDVSEAFAAAGLAHEETTFPLLLEKAGARSVDDCQRVRTICVAIEPYLVDPRGRKPALESATYELFLRVEEKNVRTSGSRDAYDDQETSAIRLAFGDSEFDPRPAQRRAIRDMQSVVGSRGRGPENTVK